MTKTYERTLFIENLEEAEVTLYVYNASKYSGKVTEEEEVKYTGLTSWSIINGEDADKYNKMFENEGMEKDTVSEYLVLRFKDLTEVVYRNSFVDMFIM